MLDIFRSDAFSVTSLTAAILKAPYKPGRIGTLGLFRESGMTTTTAVVEEKDGFLELIETSQRGAPAKSLGNQKRTAKSFVASHLERESKIMADEVQGVRAFGSEDAHADVQAIVDEKMASCARCTRSPSSTSAPAPSRASFSTPTGRRFTTCSPSSGSRSRPGHRARSRRRQIRAALRGRFSASSRPSWAASRCRGTVRSAAMRSSTRSSRTPR
jgi:hypothetical protein